MYKFVDELNAFKWQLKILLTKQNLQSKAWSSYIALTDNFEVLITRGEHYDVSIKWYTSAIVDIAFDFYPPTHTVLFRFWCKFLFFRWSFILNLDMLCSVINCQLQYGIWDFPVVFTLYHLHPSSRQLVSSESPVQCHEWNILWVLRRSLCRNFACQWRESCFSQARYE